MISRFPYKQLLLLFFLSSSIAGCSTVKGLFGDDEDEEPTITEDRTASQLYQKANGEMQSNRFADAIESYSILESRYPFGRYAQQAQLELAYLYYRQSNMDGVISSADRFIKLKTKTIRRGKIHAAVRLLKLVSILESDNDGFDNCHRRIKAFYVKKLELNTDEFYMICLKFIRDIYKTNTLEQKYI